MPIRWKFALAAWCHDKLCILSEWHDTKLGLEAERSEAAANLGAWPGQIWFIRKASHFEDESSDEMPLLEGQCPRCGYFEAWV